MRLTIVPILRGPDHLFPASSESIIIVPPLLKLTLSEIHATLHVVAPQSFVERQIESGRSRWSRDDQPPASATSALNVAAQDALHHDVHATIEGEPGNEINQPHRRIATAVSNAKHLAPQHVLADHRELPHAAILQLAGNSRFPHPLLPRRTTSPVLAEPTPATQKSNQQPAPLPTAPRIKGSISIRRSCRSFYAPRRRCIPYNVRVLWCRHRSQCSSPAIGFLRGCAFLDVPRNALVVICAVKGVGYRPGDVNGVMRRARQVAFSER